MLLTAPGTTHYRPVIEHLESKKLAQLFSKPCGDSRLRLSREAKRARQFCLLGNVGEIAAARTAIAPATPRLAALRCAVQLFPGSIAAQKPHHAKASSWLSQIAHATLYRFSTDYPYACRLLPPGRDGRLARRSRPDNEFLVRANIPSTSGNSASFHSFLLNAAQGPQLVLRARLYLAFTKVRA